MTRDARNYPLGFGGLDVVVTDALPLDPSPGTWARRFVRHQYAAAGIIDWLGEKVGPRPDSRTNAMEVGNTLYVSAEVYECLKRQVAR